jgi:hypothetical protein
MDFKALWDLLVTGGGHGMLLLLVYLLWRRMNKMESMLLECMQAGGKVADPKVDDFRR